ncbi:DUF2190 family protein [Chromobacterium haemolyticum]|uniref:DUF2190 family protein n=1 Tax=Chromobacterium haemolyticum TaxID=394935 RepID=UPI00244857F1|nr:DUF2190 family protein [Chromobacterium haemolyticum]MDH0340625.1 DUF2190 family protein [Chromobacterium haemolyticum]
MRNFLQNGNALTIPAPYDVASGGAVLVGQYFAIAATAAKKGEPVATYPGGVYELPKTPDAAFAFGDAVYFDPASNLCGAKAKGAHLIGTAAGVSGNGAALCAVRLNGAATTVAA